ncbi:formylglycine-generating enzyme family protein [Planktothrix sp. FACHB-1355]|uniref:Formylglycine-generating enzyme family protein n=1 Tax=Aerosakkonema funiforme FACHB-1375 TaxID=2949571 RepID=A0A926VBE7_9CYAN|nr:formylglycine-generating enzyme family protein [Aerosakkonema funiforme]MBD2180718.1 formylglycine-generating enzyme family protein [Aerosakkonema funiforme FACHB-1375]MBD3559208.1 formylglycine-generating enzyme family protein [Planktothrix sp. FACHB-1355]
MTENTDRPREYDAVLGGQNPPPIDAAVLGGLQGVKRRLANPEVEVRVAALSDALKYGEAGLDLIIQALQNESNQVKSTAYSLLINIRGRKFRQQIANFLPSFEFDAIAVNKLGQKISIGRRVARYFLEDLDNDIFLEMVLIPGGSFLMGSPETEAERQSYESPQHKVKISSFCMGKYPVKQAQWKAVAALPQINISLNPDPSCFKGANLPVEQVLWEEAVEFCARLSQKTGYTYRLPSEAEWEYACRAGTTTPFYFGETITSELVNYHRGETDTSEAGTTPVGIFPPNFFGLYDMHGNVFEWCADSWHDNYEGAPSDGSFWKSNDPNKLLRGGSWAYYPRVCRSAFRFRSDGRQRYPVIGFRVVCVAAWNQ